MEIGGKWPRWTTLLALAFGGVGLMSVWSSGIAHSIGEALLVSAVLGFTIDRWFKQELVHDVFQAAVGAILRPELREEVNWIVGFKWLAIKCKLHLKIEDMGGGIVKVTSTSERVVENISSHPEKTRAAIATDEWGVKDRVSQILQCALVKDGESPRQHTGVKQGEWSISAATEEVSVDRGKSVTLYYKVVEYKHINDECRMAFQIPTKNPEIEVEISETLEFSSGFSHRAEVIEQPLANRVTLNGTFLPSQSMGARWWPKVKNV